MGSNIQLNKVIRNPTLADVLNLHKKEVMLELNCHHLATIKSFNSATQTVTASINYSKTYFDRNADGTYTANEVDYPTLIDVPVVILSGGTTGLTFPIQAGDQCIILFNDRDIDNWYAGAMSGPVNTSRFHSLADGLALVGFPDISSYDTTRALLFNGTTGVGVGSSQVKIFNAVNGKLGANFTAFFTALSTFMSACSGSSTDPTLAAAAAAFITAMSVPVAPAATGPIVNIEGILE